ncbi:DUF4276 family protein [Pseudomonas syringae]|uniref:DUF4276 family protein n=1 Tax=Pseudomonas syringae TaxID=317 RepID=UPI0023F9299A|nr:DUF4276 family protein [Pseudomonas syringae]MDF5832226.1 DUF4276 family protein [Pseudomonas syringae]
MAMKFGIIAEDKSDVDVIKEFLAKYLKPSEFSVKHFVGQGCGKLKSKCQAWAVNLKKSGCDHIIIFHDLDRNDEAKLRSELNAKLSSPGTPLTLVVIPTEELEAWLLADLDAIKLTFPHPSSVWAKKIPHAETIKSPKEFLQKLVHQSCKKIYMNTTHNKAIAANARLENLLTCKSYAPFDEYMKAI